MSRFITCGQKKNYLYGAALKKRALPLDNFFCKWEDSPNCLIKVFITCKLLLFFSERVVSLSKKLENDQLQEVLIRVCNVPIIFTECYDNVPIHGVKASLCEQLENYNLQIVATITESVEDTMKELNRFIYSTTSLHLVEKYISKHKLKPVYNNTISCQPIKNQVHRVEI